MGHAKPWKVAVLVVLVAMMVGFGQLEQRKKPPPAENVAQDEEASEREEDESQAPDPVSQFLTDLVSEDSQACTTAGATALPPLPSIADLPPLPRAFWPVPSLISRSSPPDAGRETY